MSVAIGTQAARYEMIVFDWDGTLMDSAAHIVYSIQSACRDIGLNPPPDERARWIIGLGLRPALSNLLPELPESDYPKLAERYRYHFLARDRELPLFDGVSELLGELRKRGRLLGVATGKTRQGLDRAMEHTASRGFFHATRCADESHAKPHPGMLLDLMQRFSLEPSSVLMVGDTTHDLEMAANAGVDGLAVTYGAHTREDLLERSPVGCVDNIMELAEWLKTHA